MNQIPRFCEIKAKPYIGEIRRTNNGLRRRVYDGRYWQYLCMGDAHCRLQAKLTCRQHKLLPSDRNPVHPAHSNEQNQSPPVQKRISVDASRQENSEISQTQRASLPNTKLNNSLQSPSTTRTRSRTITAQKLEEKQSLPDPPVAEPPLAVTTKSGPSTENVLDAIADPSLERREIKTRNGRRVRCNGFVWKHLCAHRKTLGSKRKPQRQTTLPATIVRPIPSEATALLPTATMNTRKRKTAGDVNAEEHLVPKRKTNGKRRADSNKSITLQLENSLVATSMANTFEQEKSIDKIGLVDVDLPLSLKPNQLYTSYPSPEIPWQTSVSSVSYDSSPSMILEEFGTIIKKEVVEESCLTFPTVYSESIELHCETLQDFLRLEELKEKDFQLDCQRIAYRLAKIQDCLGNASSTVS